jgi:hypothetical protein
VLLKVESSVVLSLVKSSGRPLHLLWLVKNERSIHSYLIFSANTYAANEVEVSIYLATPQHRQTSVAELWTKTKVVQKYKLPRNPDFDPFEILFSI